MEPLELELVDAEIELVSGIDLALLRAGHLTELEVHRCVVTATVDRKSTMLVISPEVQQQLNLRVIRSVEAEFADGSSEPYGVVGPVEVRFQNRRTSVEALVIPNSTKVLLGEIPMEGMDVLIDPKRERLIVNPDSPDVAKVLLM
ncbi:clan AA aspartic protease [Alkalinema sp. FACHB-956]|uniref:clan AA aspartic protease n=1 Tax=Alkalinema sp. FACHB-956 TaxID=2692768 RepID=UPI0016845AA2|nr:clan AA aspartic protease [Alkalinema sp. FACHB-956]MBD2327070.1 clan AA aspartic protease [Alkalinema sp. FACHB-956]